MSQNNHNDALGAFLQQGQQILNQNGGINDNSITLLIGAAAQIGLSREEMETAGPQLGLSGDDTQEIIEDAGLRREGSGGGAGLKILAVLAVLVMFLGVTAGAVAFMVTGGLSALQNGGDVAQNTNDGGGQAQPVVPNPNPADDNNPGGVNNPPQPPLPNPQPQPPQPQPQPPQPQPQPPQPQPQPPVNNPNPQPPQPQPQPPVNNPNPQPPQPQPQPPVNNPNPAPQPASQRVAQLKKTSEILLAKNKPSVTNPIDTLKETMNLTFASTLAVALAQKNTAKFDNLAGNPPRLDEYMEKLKPKKEEPKKQPGNGNTNPGGGINPGGGQPGAGFGGQPGAGFGGQPGAGLAGNPGAGFGGGQPGAGLAGNPGAGFGGGQPGAGLAGNPGAGFGGGQPGGLAGNPGAGFGGGQPGAGLAGARGGIQGGFNFGGGQRGGRGFAGQRGGAGFAGQRGGAGFAGQRGGAGFAGQRGGAGFAGQRGGAGIAGQRGGGGALGFGGGAGIAGQRGGGGALGIGGGGVGFGGQPGAGFAGQPGGGLPGGTPPKVESKFSNEELIGMAIRELERGKTATRVQAVAFLAQNTEKEDLPTHYAEVLASYLLSANKTEFRYIAQTLAGLKKYRSLWIALGDLSARKTVSATRMQDVLAGMLQQPTKLTGDTEWRNKARMLSYQQALKMDDAVYDGDGIQLILRDLYKGQAAMMGLQIGDNVKHPTIILERMIRHAASELQNTPLSIAEKKFVKTIGDEITAANYIAGNDLQEMVLLQHVWAKMLAMQTTKANSASAKDAKSILEDMEAGYQSQDNVVHQMWNAERHLLRLWMLQLGQPVMMARN